MLYNHVRKNKCLHFVPEQKQKNVHIKMTSGGVRNISSLCRLRQKLRLSKISAKFDDKTKARFGDKTTELWSQGFEFFKKHMCANEINNLNTISLSLVSL